MLGASCKHKQHITNGRGFLKIMFKAPRVFFLKVRPLVKIRHHKYVNGGEGYGRKKL